MRRRPSSLAEAPVGRAEFAAAFGDLQGASHVLAAVSGGPDSVALMHALAAWAQDRGTSLSVATVDHGLRPGSQDEAAAVGAAADRLRLQHRILTWTDRARSGPVSQEGARRARYRLLLAHARQAGASHLTTAHTLDDQAETLMMRLAAGSGPAGLAGMRPVVDRGGIRHVRPLLSLPKARLIATCRAEGWPYIDDPSNADPRFARARWRSLLPGLAGEGLDASRLGKLAERMRRAEDALGRTAELAFAELASVGPGPTIVLSGTCFSSLLPEIALRVLALALGTAPDAAEPHIRLDRLEACLEAILSAQRGGRVLRRTLAGRLIGLDRNGDLTVGPEPPRQRGRRKSVTEIDSTGPGPLGIGLGRA